MTQSARLIRVLCFLLLLLPLSHGMAAELPEPDEGLRRWASQISQERYALWLQRLIARDMDPVSGAADPGSPPGRFSLDPAQQVKTQRFLRSALLSMGFDSAQTASEEFEITKNSSSSIQHYEFIAPDFRIQGRNLIAEIPGSRFPDETVVVGAHYDTLGHIDGANDNGSGVAALLSIAEVFMLSGVQPERTVRFVLFDAEEVGLLGSKHHFEQALLRGDEITLFINMDIIGFGPARFDHRTGRRLPHRNTLAVNGGPFHERIADALDRSSQKLSSGMSVDRSFDGGSFEMTPKEYFNPASRIMPSDSISALLNGFPAATVSENSTLWTRGPGAWTSPVFFRKMHSREDVFTEVNTNYAAGISRIVGATLLEVARSRIQFDTAEARAHRERLRRKLTCEKRLQGA